MTATLVAAPAAPPLASFRRSLSAPIPWHAVGASRRAAAALIPAAAARAPRVSAALARPPGPQFRRARSAVRRRPGGARPGGAATAARRPAVRSATATTLAPTLPQAHEPGETPCIAVQALICVAGKKLDLRGTHPMLEVTHHACARFVERSGRTDPAALQAAVEEAAGHAQAVLVAHLDGRLAYRLRGGTAPVLLPAGEGAFLGHLRLLPIGRDGVPVPVIGAATWLHAASLDTPQIAARDVLLAGLPPAIRVAALAEAWAGLRASVAGDRRVLAGLETMPLRTGAPRQQRLALASCALMALARLVLGLACPDTLATEWLGLR